jgi:hypothetical protein
MNTRPFLILSRALFFLGVATGLTLSVLLIWNNFESTNYYFKGVKYAPFKGLQCPVIMAPTEKGIVTAVINNPTNEADRFFYRAEISGKAFSRRTIEDQIVVPPHQARKAQFKVDANDVDLRFFILVKITILPNSVRDTQEATCGIMVADVLGLTGAQVSVMALFLSIPGIAVGLGRGYQTSAKTNRVMQALGFCVLLALFAAYMSWWGIAIALTAVILLLMVISLH